MAKDIIRNLLKNPSFEDGAEAPAGWEWVVLAGIPVWSFDAKERFGAGRSIRILQDGRSWHGEFRQTVACKPSTRYRLRGRIRVAVEGTGGDSGANLYLRSLAGDRQVHDMWFRPFFIGREDWRIWSADYVTPKDADRLVVSFDMRHAAGVAWFDALELFEVPAPLDRSVGPAKTHVITSPVKRAATVRVICDEVPGYLVREVLSPLVGKANVKVGDAKNADAVVVYQRGKKPLVSFDALRKLSREKTVIVTPAALAASTGGKAVRVRTVEETLVAPCARIEVENFLTRGFAAGDVLPWWTDPEAKGTFSQVRIAAGRKWLQDNGLEVIATGVSASGAGDPVILYRPGENGGALVVMDLEILNEPPGPGAEANLAGLILTNALGRPQTTFGTYTVTDFEYDGFCEMMGRVAAEHPSITLREEGKSAEGRPILSLALGPADAPTFYVDCGIHSDEWAPCFGAVYYAARLAEEFERGLPWARALLKELRFKCIPILSPDGWKNHVRFIRGLDLNRNFAKYWDEYDHPTKGSAPCSEPETRAVAEIFRRDKVIAAVNWHETTANTNWVGTPGADGRYRKYAASVPAIFRQSIDGRWFAHQAATWTQIFDPRNHCWHTMDSFPYVRDYSPQRVPYELFHADSLGIDGITIEQYGNSDVNSFSTSPQRTDLTGHIIEMLFGLQIGLLARGHNPRTTPLSIPLAVPVVRPPCGPAHGCEGRAPHEGGALRPILTGKSRGEAVIYSADGKEIERVPLLARGGVATVEAELPPGGVLLVELNPAPWKENRSPAPSWAGPSL